MSREEELTRRLCAYAKLDIEVTDDGVMIIQPEDETKHLTYDSWRQILFGGPFCLSLFEMRFILNNWRTHWGEHLGMLASLEFSSLDELELQLSIRGF